MDARAPRVRSRACMHDAHPTGFSGGLLPASTHPSGQWLARRQPPTTSPSHRAREASSPLVHKRLITPGTRRVGVPGHLQFFLSRRYFHDFCKQIIFNWLSFTPPLPPPRPRPPALPAFPRVAGTSRASAGRASRPAGSPRGPTAPPPASSPPLLPAPASVAVGVPGSGEGPTDCLPGALARCLRGAAGWVAGRRARTPLAERIAPRFRWRLLGRAGTARP